MLLDMDVVQAFAVAVILGGVTAAWAFMHFHEMHRPEEIRFSVPQQRYFAAIGAHVSVILAIYAILILAIYGIIALASGTIPPLDCYSPNIPARRWKVCEESKLLNTDALVWSSLASVFFVRLVMPNVAVIRRLMDRLRDVMHDFALFPVARQALVSELSISGFTAREGAEAELFREVARYGVASKWLSFLSRSANQSLLEALSLRRRLLELSDRSEAFGAALWQHTSYAKKALLVGGSQVAEESGFGRRQTLERFGRARAAVFAQLETDFRRLIRRTALALLLGEEIGENPGDEALYRAASNFVAEECDDVAARYRQLIAEAALSCVPHREERAQFLKSFGYEKASVPPVLPLRPWIIVFVLDFLLFLVPFVVMGLTDRNPQFPMTGLALFAGVHAISQTIAITWAIYPKIPSNFARPSLYSLPWQSYVVYGAASYVTGATILFIFRLGVPLAFPILVPTLISSVSFLIMTVGTSFLIDRRLQSRT